MNRRLLTSAVIIGWIGLVATVGYATDVVEIDFYGNYEDEASYFALRYFEGTTSAVTWSAYSGKNTDTDEGAVIDTWDWTWPSFVCDEAIVGEDSDDWSTWTFRFDDTGKGEIVVKGTEESGAWGEARAWVYAFKVNLDVDGVDDADEEDPGGYIAFNDDDDDENGVPDYDDDVGDASEDDLVKIDLMEYLPTDLAPGCIELEASSSLKVWSDEHKAAGSLVIPNGPRGPNLWYKRWELGSTVPELWVEGYGYGTGGLALWYTTSDANTPKNESVYPYLYYNYDLVNLTGVWVDMEMVGVAPVDEESVGGFVPLGGVKRIDLYRVQPDGVYTGVPVDSSHPVTFDVTSGSSKVQIWDNAELTGSSLSLPVTYTDRLQLPTALWVEGVEASATEKDVTLVMEYSVGGRTIQDRIKLTVVGVEIPTTGDGVLFFADDSHPTQYLDAVGSPAGGTYGWSVVTTGTGDISIVSGAADSRVTFRGAAASSSEHDTILRVSYTFGTGMPPNASHDNTVITPTYTNSFPGVLDESGEGPLRRVRRYYYHQPIDQFNTYSIDRAGIHCDEILVWKEGAVWSRGEGPGDTQDWDEDGSWEGGICVRDTIAGSWSHSYARYEQEVKVAGAWTSPRYMIYVDPMDDDPDGRMWKDPISSP